MEDLRYIYAVARVRVLETRLLKKEIFLNILDADTLDAALRILGETASYPLDILNIRDSKGTEAFTDIEMQKLERQAKELFVEPTLFEAFVSLKKDLLRSYYLILKTKSNFLKDFIKRYIDLYNIKTFLRMKYQKKSLEDLKLNLLEGGYTPKTELINLWGKDLGGFYRQAIKDGITQIEKEDNFGVLEREIDDYLLNLMRPAKYIFFGPEPVFGYCLAKEQELKFLRLALLAKINNISKPMLQERLTQTYA